MSSLWFLAFEVYGEGPVERKRKTVGEKVKCWLNELKSNGGFAVDARILDAAKVDFESERVSDKLTLATITSTHAWKIAAPKQRNSFRHSRHY